MIAPGDRARARAGHRRRRSAARRHAVRARHWRTYDAVLAMYHDQGLPVLKYATFGHGVNVTLGLPFVRTSVDHGTALDLAGTGRADAGSLRAALELASGWPHAEPPADDGRRAAAAPRAQALRPELPARSARHRAHRRCHRPAARRRDRRDRPGPGALTRALIERAGHITRDRDRPRSGGVAAQRFRAEQLTLIDADALDFDWSALPADRCGSSATCRTTSRRRCCSALMPIAERVTRPALHAAEGSRRPHGRGARQQDLWPAVGDAAVRYRHDASSSTSPRGAFRPAPKVTSSIVRMEPLPRRGPAGVDLGGFGRSSRPPSASAARPCATRWRAGADDASARPRSIPGTRRNACGGRLRAPDAGRRRRTERVLVRPLDQLDLVAVRVGDERDHRGAALDRAGLARDLSARRADAFAGADASGTAIAM